MEFAKGKSDLGSSDTAWIDMIVFPGSVGSDGDGMPDGWEIYHKLTSYSTIPTTIPTTTC